MYYRCSQQKFKRACQRWFELGMVAATICASFLLFSYKFKKILPANLSIIFFNSRDTWDKQYIESTLIFKIYDFIIRLLFRAPHKICNRLSLRMLANIFDKIHFVFYRTALLTSYAFYILFRPLLKSYEKNLRGSELLIILQKPANRQGK